MFALGKLSVKMGCEIFFKRVVESVDYHFLRGVQSAKILVFGGIELANCITLIIS